MNVYKMTYKTGNLPVNVVIVKGINAQAVRERYSHFDIIALQNYESDDIGFQAFSN